MDFKDLNLDRSRIEAVIAECVKPGSVLSCSKKGRGSHYTIERNGKKALIIIFFNRTGTTTIVYDVGKNPDLSLEVAECIKEKTLITRKKAFSLAFRDVTDEHFKALLDYLTEQRTETISDQTTHTCRIMRLRSQYGDEVTITYYSNRTLMIQGRPLFLYTEVKLFFYVGLDFEEVVKKESDTYEVPISSADIRKELESFMPNAYGFLDEKIKKILTPAICLNKLMIDLEDYSAFVFPALRALEGYIRQLLSIKAKDPSVRSANNIGSLFEDGHQTQPQLQRFARTDINCSATCDALEYLYSVYKTKRHPYFHVSRILQTTPIIARKDLAESYLVDILKAIEETYSKIFLK